MHGTTATKAGSQGRLGVMVRTPTEIFVYWRPVGTAGDTLVVRITDLTGRSVHELDDRTGYRDLSATPSIYMTDLLPGHLYLVEVGRFGPKGFTPSLAAGPVQTPWRAAERSTGFPSLYHRS